MNQPRTVTSGESHFRDSAGVTHRGMVLSIFPGIDLLGMAFEEEGFCVVRGPDPLWGGDIRRFHPPAGHFSGVIGGSPCQDFSAARRDEPTGEGIELLQEFIRVVEEADADWFLLENVPRVPSVTASGFRMQRIDFNALEAGSKQDRLRHFQFGSRSGLVITAPRSVTQLGHQASHTCIASEASRGGRRRTWPEFCALQGLPEGFDLPPFRVDARYRAVGNGVPLPMGRAMARAIRGADAWWTKRLCACGCGRPVTGKAVLATVACRKRTQRKRDRAGASRDSMVAAEMVLSFTAPDAQC